MSACINLQNPLSLPVPCDLLKSAAREVLAQHPAYRECGLTIVITNAKALRALNDEHRKVDAPTDVLSYSAEPLPAEIEEGLRYIGDILIAYDYVEKSLVNRTPSLNDALCLLVAHGTLHLLGYEHNGPESRNRMWAAQASALATLGINPGLVSEYAESVNG